MFGASVSFHGVVYKPKFFPIVWDIYIPGSSLLSQLPLRALTTFLKGGNIHLNQETNISLPLINNFLATSVPHECDTLHNSPILAIKKPRVITVIFPVDFYIFKNSLSLQNMCSLRALNVQLQMSIPCEGYVSIWMPQSLCTQRQSPGHLSYHSICQHTEGIIPSLDFSLPTKPLS